MPVLNCLCHWALNIFQGIAKQKIEVTVDFSSGPGSLLINIGRSIAKHRDDKNKILYYAQELKQNTYKLICVDSINKTLWGVLSF